MPDRYKNERFYRNLWSPEDPVRFAIADRDYPGHGFGRASIRAQSHIGAAFPEGMNDHNISRLIVQGRNLEDADFFKEHLDLVAGLSRVNKESDARRDSLGFSPDAKIQMLAREMGSKARNAAGVYGERAMGAARSLARNSVPPEFLTRLAADIQRAAMKPELLRGYLRKPRT